MNACECCGNDDAGYAVCTECLTEDCQHGIPREDVFLVAFGVSGAASRDAAQDLLMAELQSRLPLGAGPLNATAYVEEWWVAENDRRDGSDNRSATFVPYEPAGDDEGAVAS